MAQLYIAKNARNSIGQLYAGSIKWCGCVCIYMQCKGITQSIDRSQPRRTVPNASHTLWLHLKWLSAGRSASDFFFSFVLAVNGNGRLVLHTFCHGSACHYHCRSHRRRRCHRDSCVSSLVSNNTSCDDGHTKWRIVKLINMFLRSARRDVVSVECPLATLMDTAAVTAESR